MEGHSLSLFYPSMCTIPDRDVGVKLKDEEESANIAKKRSS